MRKQSEIEQWLEEAEDRVSYARKVVTLNQIMRGADIAPPGYDQSEWTKTRLELLREGMSKIMKRGHFGNDPLGNFDYEYWVGVMAGLRYALGCDKHDRDT